MKKRLIRKLVFETNSSSSHSISLASEDKEFVLDTIYPDQNGFIVLNGGQFGWEWFKHNDALTKANYAAQSLGMNDNLIDVIKEQTGAIEVLFNTSDGYIDHDSHGLVPHDKEGLRNFIFNKNSWLFGGNDNDYADPTFYHVPIITKDVTFMKSGRYKIIYPEYKYELIIDGLNKTTKFLEEPTDQELQNGIESLVNGRLMNDDGKFLDDEISNNIFFKLSKNKDFFEKSWQIQQDYSKKYILMTKENSIYQIEDKLKNSGKFENLDWREREKLTKKEILKNKDLFRKVKFTVKEIKNG